VAANEQQSACVSYPLEERVWPFWRWLLCFSSS